MNLSFFEKAVLLSATLISVGYIVTSHVLERTTGGMDFYQYWGVGLGPKLSEGALKSPYIELSKYTALLDSYDIHFNDPQFHVAHRVSHEIYPEGLDIPGTPLLYALFAGMPLDYSQAFSLFSTIQMTLFIGAFVLLFSYKKTKWSLFMALSVALLDYGPLEVNVRVGNLAAAQFFAIVVLAIFCEKIIKNCLSNRALFFSVFFMSALALLTLIKPNIALVTLILSASLWRLQGGRVFVAAAAIAGVIGAAVVAASCTYFGSWAVWSDWCGYLSDISKKLSYSVESGNYATTHFLAETFNIDVKSIMVAAFFLLVVHSGQTVLKVRPVQVPVLRFIWQRIACLLEDPFLCVALATTVTLAISPLVWSHYYVLSLVPALYLIAVSPKWSYIELLGVASVALTSGALTNFIGRNNLTPYSMACGWIPLWFGIQAVIASRKAKILE